MSADKLLRRVVSRELGMEIVNEPGFSVEVGTVLRRTALDRYERCGRLSSEVLGEIVRDSYHVDLTFGSGLSVVAKASGEAPLESLGLGVASCGVIVHKERGDAVYVHTKDGVQESMRDGTDFREWVDHEFKQNRDIRERIIVTEVFKAHEAVLLAATEGACAIGIEAQGKVASIGDLSLSSVGAGWVVRQHKGSCAVHILPTTRRKSLTTVFVRGVVFTRKWLTPTHVDEKELGDEIYKIETASFSFDVSP